MRKIQMLAGRSCLIVTDLVVPDITFSGNTPKISRKMFSLIFCPNFWHIRDVFFKVLQCHLRCYTFWKIIKHGKKFALNHFSNHGTSKTRPGFGYIPYPSLTRIMMAADHRMHSMQIQRPSRSFFPSSYNNCVLLRENKNSVWESGDCSVILFTCSSLFSYILPSEGYPSDLLPYNSFF